VLRHSLWGLILVHPGRRRDYLEVALRWFFCHACTFPRAHPKTLFICPFNFQYRCRAALGFPVGFPGIFFRAATDAGDVSRPQSVWLRSPPTYIHVMETSFPLEYPPARQVSVFFHQSCFNPLTPVGARGLRLRVFRPRDFSFALSPTGRSWARTSCGLCGFFPPNTLGSDHHPSSGADFASAIHISSADVEDLPPRFFNSGDPLAHPFVSSLIC